MRCSLTLVALFAATPALAKTADERIDFAPAPSWAQQSEPLTVPADARGLLFVRRQDLQAHLGKAGQQFHSTILIRLLHPNALQAGNISLAWNPAAGKPVVHAVKVYRDGTARDVLAGSRFEILQRENQLEAAMLDGVLTAALRVPDLRVGDELEVSYTVPAHDPTLGADSFGMLFWAGAMAPGRFALRLSWDEGQEPKLQPSADMAALLRREPRGIAITTDMPATLNPPKDAPPRYAWQRVVQFSDCASWQAVSSRLAPLFRKAATLSVRSTVKEEAARIAAAHSDPAARAAAALQLVQQQVRYVYVGFSGGNMTPASAEATWERRYGDCKGKTALLLALLSELGIAAEPVLVDNNASDDGLDQRLPNPGAFDHVVVRARIGGENWWLDGTLPPVFTPVRAPVMPYRWVLPLSADGSAIEPLAWRPATSPDAIHLTEIDAREGFAKPAVRKVVTIQRGPEAIVDYYRFSAATDQELLDATRKGLEGGDSWDTVESVKWRFDAGKLASVMEITGRGPVDWDDDGNGSKSLSLPGGGFIPPERRQRGSEQDQTAPYYNKPGYNCHVTTVRLPTATAVKDWSFNKTFDTVFFGETYRRSFERRDGTIRMIRAKRTLVTEIDPASAAKDNERLAKFDNSMAWIHFDPGSSDRPGPRETVPATYEIDWLADDSACLTPQRGGK